MSLGNVTAQCTNTYRGCAIVYEVIFSLQIFLGRLFNSCVVLYLLQGSKRWTTFVTIYLVRSRFTSFIGGCRKYLHGGCRSAHAKTTPSTLTSRMIIVDRCCLWSVFIMVSSLFFFKKIPDHKSWTDVFSKIPDLHFLCRLSSSIPHLEDPWSWKLDRCCRENFYPLLVSFSGLPWHSARFRALERGNCLHVPTIHSTQKLKFEITM